MQTCKLDTRCLIILLFGLILFTSCGKENENQIEFSKNTPSVLDQRIGMIKAFSLSLSEVESRTKELPLFEQIETSNFISFVEDVINYNYGTSPLDLEQLKEIKEEIQIYDLSEIISFEQSKTIYLAILDKISKKYYSDNTSGKVFSFIDVTLEENNFSISIFIGNLKENINIVQSRGGNPTPNNYFYAGQVLELHRGEDNATTGDPCSYDCNNWSQCAYTSNQIGIKGFDNYWFNMMLPSGGTWINVVTKTHSSDNVIGWWKAPRYSTVPCANYTQLNNYVDVTTQMLHNEEAILGKKCFQFDMFDGIFTFPFDNHRYVWMSLDRWGNYVFNPEKEELPGN